MLKRFAIVALCVAATATLFSQNVQSPGRIYGAGATTCSAWQAQANGNLPDAVQASWVLGYLSAAGAPIKEEVNPQWLHGFLNGYCEQRKESTLAAASQEMVRLLTTRGQ